MSKFQLSDSVNTHPRSRSHSCDVTKSAPLYEQNRTYILLDLYKVYRHTTNIYTKYNLIT